MENNEIEKKEIAFRNPPQWDLTEESIRNGDYVDFDWDNDSLVIIEGYFSVIYRMISNAEEAFSPEYLWEKHSPFRINKIIDEWNNNKKLCPILFCLNEKDDLGTGLNVVSGNHRLSVLRAYYGMMKKDFVFPFLMKKEESSWLLEKISVLKKNDVYNMIATIENFFKNPDEK